MSLAVSPQHAMQPRRRSGLGAWFRASGNGDDSETSLYSGAAKDGKDDDVESPRPSSRILSNTSLVSQGSNGYGEHYAFDSRPPSPIGYTCVGSFVHTLALTLLRARVHICTGILAPRFLHCLALRR